MSKLLKKQKDELNKFYKKNKKEDTDLDDLIKELNEKNKLLKQQKQEEGIPWDIISELTRNSKEMTENINSESPTILRTFSPRRDPFDDINENKEKPTPSPSKIPAPITKSLEPQGLATGEQAGIEIMKNDLKNSKNYTEYLKK